MAYGTDISWPATVVAGRRDDQDAFRESPGRGLFHHRVERRVHAHRRAERHRHHRATLAHRGFDTGQYPRIRGAPRDPVKYFADKNLGLPGDSIARRVWRGNQPRSASGSNAVRPMAEDVLLVLSVHKRLRRDRAPDKIGMLTIDPRVKHRHTDAGAIATRHIGLGCLETPRHLHGRGSRLGSSSEV